MSRTKKRSLTGLHVVITGGARGIGEATARLLVNEGAKVSIGDIDVLAAEVTAKEINDLRAGEVCAAYEVNVTDEGSFTTFLSAAEAAFGNVDVLINNAGIMSVGSFINEPIVTMERQINVNIIGVITGTRAALRLFRPLNRGQIINVASIAARFPLAGIATYSGTKHFVIGFTEALRSEYKETGIEFTTVLPNITDTRLGAGVSGFKMVPKCAPEDIAAAIAQVIAKPRARVFIPGFLAQLVGATGPLPAKTYDWIFEKIGADKAMTDIDEVERLNYETSFRN